MSAGVCRRATVLSVCRNCVSLLPVPSKFARACKPCSASAKTSAARSPKVPPRNGVASPETGAKRRSVSRSSASSRQSYRQRVFALRHHKAARPRSRQAHSDCHEPASAPRISINRFTRASETELSDGLPNRPRSASHRQGGRRPSRNPENSCPRH